MSTHHDKTYPSHCVSALHWEVTGADYRLLRITSGVRRSDWKGVSSQNVLCPVPSFIQQLFVSEPGSVPGTGNEVGDKSPWSTLIRGNTEHAH